MAKKGNRIIIAMQCSACKNRNYVTSKNVINTKDKIAMEKFCSTCRKNTEHNETTKFK